MDKVFEGDEEWKQYKSWRIPDQTSRRHSSNSFGNYSSTLRGVQAHEESLVLDVPVPGACVLQVGVVPDLQAGRLLPVLRPAGCVACAPRGKAQRKA